MTEATTTMPYERDGRVARITLNRPERGNGITLEMPRELAACVERANLDPEVHAIALAGNGSGFCGGFDPPPAAAGRFRGGGAGGMPSRSPGGPAGGGAGHPPHRGWGSPPRFPMMLGNRPGLL